ncbi:MAG: hypothetical protein GY861_02435 [bacterium]|nr:hypothetical protein [bacterium]
MTKKTRKNSRSPKPATTTRIKIHYTNGTTYTIPNASDILVVDGKKLLCNYRKDVQDSGIRQTVDLGMTLEGVEGIDIRGKHCESDMMITVAGGEVVAQTTYRTKDGAMSPPVQFSTHLQPSLLQLKAHGVF